MSPLVCVNAIGKTRRKPLHCFLTTEKKINRNYRTAVAQPDQWRFGRIPKVKISLEYLDEGKGSIEVIYDSRDNTQKKLDTIMLSGSGTWKTWTREVDDAMFACSIAQPYRNDDLVFVTRTTEPLSVARVSITRGAVNGPMTR